MNARMASAVRRELLGRWEPVYRSRLHYLVTWGTRGRKPVLKDRHIQSIQRLISQICEERGISLLDATAGGDHVHVLFSLRPAQSVATAIRELKSRTAITMMAQHPELRVWLGAQLLWDDRYSVETLSHGRVQRVQERLRARHRSIEEMAQAS